ncbi:TRAP transporter substrate-binding protein DctP [Deltaproteobacteria bacterium OttesenSCG-928-M10]|nr:TRAP transporter substrate-binding protein DctP [Deltaproteobacteria bacterium OttesenSCG-928-M10]
MKKVLCLVAMIITLSLFCGPVQAAVTLKFSGQYPMEHPTSIIMQEFADAVKERTKGEVIVKLFPANQLGDYIQVYEEVKRGTIEMALITIPGQFDPRLEVAILPYIALNYDDIRKFYVPGSNLYKLSEELHEAQGVQFLGFNIEGFGGLGALKMPENLDKANADRNFILRVPSMITWQIIAEDQGFQVITIPFADLYTSLQTGVADGWYGGPASDNWFGFRDVIKYFITVNNSVLSTGWVINKATFNKLSPEHQKVLQEEAARLGEKSIGISEEGDKKLLEEMENYGIKVVHPTPEQIQAWADQARNVSWPRLEEALTKELIDALKAEYK